MGARFAWNQAVGNTLLKVSDADATRIKNDVAAEFKKIFTEGMQKNNHEVVDTTGSDVLVLRPAIINLIVTSPDLHKMNRSSSFSGDAGAMTLYLELYDSVFSAKLVEIIDAQDAGRHGGNMMHANKVTNTAAADRILRACADELAGHLGDVQAGTDVRTSATSPGQPTRNPKTSAAVFRNCQ